jgi:urea transport system permease protein
MNLFKIKNILFRQKHLDRSEIIWLFAFAGFLGIALIYPLWADSYSISIMRDTVIFGLLALSLDYLWGKSGLLSFGHAAFFGMGAYGMAIFSLNLNTIFASMIGIAASVIVPGLVALLIGYFLIFAGIRGPYFVIVMLALGIVSQQAAISWVTVTGGDSGLLGIPPLTFGIFDFKYEFFEGLPLYYLIIGISSLILLGLWIACRGHYGNILKAIQDNETRARALGHNTSLHLLIVMVISAMIAGLAGGFYAASTGFVAPDLIGLLLSTEIFVWVAIGGRGSLLGPFVGAFAVIRLEQLISSINISLWPLIIGIFFVAMVFLFPDGIITIFRNITVLFTRKAKLNLK